MVNSNVLVLSLYVDMMKFAFFPLKKRNYERIDCVFLSRPENFLFIEFLNIRDGKKSTP